jgi:hypothetical protein
MVSFYGTFLILGQVSRLLSKIVKKVRTKSTSAPENLLATKEIWSILVPPGTIAA